MTATRIAYRVASSHAPDEWCDDPSAADAAAARRLGLAADDASARRTRVTADPVVVRREDGRWRSRAVWSMRGDAGVVRVYEMLHIDETQYDH